MNEGYSKTRSQAVNLDLMLNYKINNVFAAKVQYNYTNGNDEVNNLYGQNSFYMRDLINQFTTPGSFVRNIPLGGIYLPIVKKSENQTLRGLLTVNKTWMKNTS